MFLVPVPHTATFDVPGNRGEDLFLYVSLLPRCSVAFFFGGALVNHGLLPLLKWDTCKKFVCQFILLKSSHTELGN